MKVVLTGSSGSVGSAVIDAALSHTTHTLKLIDKTPPKEPVSDPRVEYLIVDLLNYDNFLAALQGADALIHLAGIPDPMAKPAWLVHNTNVCLSYNALQAAADAGVNKVVLASSVNALGGVFSLHDPIFNYFPVDEDHPVHHSDPYSLSKYIAELQAASIARANPSMSICCLRFHHVTPVRKNDSQKVSRARKDLWGYVGTESAGRACLLALEVGWTGAEVIHITGDEHTAQGHHAEDLLRTYFPAAEIRGTMTKDQSMFDCCKAERLLGWKHVGGRQPGSNMSSLNGGEGVQERTVESE